MEKHKDALKERDEWFNNVDDVIKEKDYPLHLETAKVKLRDTIIGGEKASMHFDLMEWPVMNREKFMERYRRAARKR
jgi:hypothetical protein